jgi:hypothetical protein
VELLKLFDVRSCLLFGRCVSHRGGGGGNDVIFEYVEKERRKVSVCLFYFFP